MLFNPETTITDIVRSDYRTADVFKKYGIGFCCGGQASLVEACTVRKMDYNVIVEELEGATRNIRVSNNLEFDKWKIDFLIAYIINIHHAFFNIAAPSLEATLVAFTEGHKKKYAELQSILIKFQKLVALSASHNRHEEDIIFPYIKQIESVSRSKESYGSLFVRTLRKPLESIEEEHRQIRFLLEQIKSLTNNYSFPQSACTNYQVIYHRLKEFHDDMVQHTHLEHSILFPRAMQMEMELLQL